jgi:hypothetical protein
MHANGESIRVIASKTGVSKSLVANILKEQGTHITLSNETDGLPKHQGDLPGGPPLLAAGMARRRTSDCGSDGRAPASVSRSGSDGGSEQ